MSIAPPRMPGDGERSQWYSSEHSGKVVSLDELKELFEDFKGIEIVGGNKDHTVYGIRKSWPSKIAYECNNCENLVVGPPRVEDDTSIDDGVPLSGRLGYDIYCTQCSSNLDRHTIAVS